MPTDFRGFSPRSLGAVFLVWRTTMPWGNRFRVPAIEEQTVPALCVCLSDVLTPFCFVL